MIPMVDLESDPPPLKSATRDAIDRVLASGRFILGDEVRAFEHRWAAACGVGHGIGVASGTDALEIGLRALGVGSNDEVIVPACTAFATILAVLRCGASPVLADIEPDTALLSMASVRRCHTPRTKAVVLVHLYGQMHSMSAWVSLCRDLRVALVEDCAHAHGARWQGGGAGSFGRFGAYSFYPTKNLGALGDAGMIVTGDEELAHKARAVRNLGRDHAVAARIIGVNSRLDEMQAAVLSCRSDWLARFNAARGRIATTYRAQISNPRVQLLAQAQEPSAHVHHLFVITASHRDALQAHLAEHGVESAIHYTPPAHLEAPCLSLRRDPVGLRHAEGHAARCVSIPCHPNVTDADARTVAAAINSFR